MVLPGFVILACVKRVLVFDFSFAGTPFSRVAEVPGRMTPRAILTVQL
jgi:hypothetical protein